MPDLSQLHLMRPEWLWTLIPALVLSLLLWRIRSRSGGWSDVIAPDLLPFLIGKSAGKKAPNLLPFKDEFQNAGGTSHGRAHSKWCQTHHMPTDSMYQLVDY